MIGYAVIGAQDLDASLAFWDAVTAELGGKRLTTLPDGRGFTLYGAGRDRPMLAVTRPYDGGEAHPGNGTMLALPLPTRAAVDHLHGVAMEAGGSDEGAPGLRGGVGDQKFYGAYFRDPAGNKVCAYRIGQE